MAEAKKRPNFLVRGWMRIRRYFRELRSELKKVVWTSKRQMLNNTLIVLLCVLIVGVFIWIFDALGGLIIDGIIALVKG